MRRHLLLTATLRNERCGARTNRGDRKLVLANPSRLDRTTRCSEPGASAPAPSVRLVRICFTGLLLPHYQVKVSTISLPALFGKVAIMLWLGIKSSKPPALDATGSSLVAG